MGEYSSRTQMKEFTYTIDFEHMSLGDISKVGGKNTSLEELFNALKPMGGSFAVAGARGIKKAPIVLAGMSNVTRERR